VFLFHQFLKASSNTHYKQGNDNYHGLSEPAIHSTGSDGGGGGLRSSNHRWDPKTLPGLTKLRPIDVERYTIRINTWRRPEQLLISVDHHSSCDGVAEIQIVWCDKENEPPDGLYNYSKVVIERHKQNTLNERFRILSPTPTLGILSIDDDVLRPCEAIDSGFFKWTQFPNRMIGFDARVHVENKTDDSWAYGYMR